MKRNENLIPLSREHHFGLLCSWKIREGVKLGIEFERIKDYINYFWSERLQHHFNAEDTVFEPIKKDDSFFVMEREHDEIEKLIALINQSNNSDLLIEFADALQNHIRFEERELFPHLEQTLTKNELSSIGKKLSNLIIEGEDKYADEFWKHSKKY